MNRLILVMLLNLAVAAACTAQPESEAPLVLTSIGPVHQVTRALTANTTIKVANIPERPRSLAAQPTLFARQGAQFNEQFLAADAVVTIGKLWAEDSFYTTAREANIRIVNIDASKPWSHIFSGVAVASSPVTGMVSPYFWTSPSNIIQMHAIIARDLQTLFPDQADTISSNLDSQRGYFLGLKADFETRFLAVDDPVVYALADEFIYLTRDLGIFVDDYFIKQDIDWSGEDLNRLTRYLDDSGIEVVLHKWEPSAEIQEAIASAGARLVVLDLLETTTEDFRNGISANLEKLLAALTQ